VLLRQWLVKIRSSFKNLIQLTTDMIPAWNISAVLPPVRPGAVGHSPDRSPYSASFADVVVRFATSPERIAILRGLLRYRGELVRRGIATGFQWLNGSFMEQKEVLESTPPNDVDVVTFFSLPPGIDEATLLATAGELFNSGITKPQYHVDAYACLLGGPMSPADVRIVSYWYSMWSHRRNGLWKGFVQVDISPTEDNIADALLAQIEQEGAKP
jgi:hypothetical protein